MSDISKEINDSSMEENSSDWTSFQGKSNGLILERDCVRLESQKSLSYVFGKTLRIPDYQRGYCWDEERVKSMLESLWTADRTKSYHLGTIIIHRYSNEHKQEQWDIVDGQQRLITLALLIHALKFECEQFAFLKDNQTKDPDVQFHLSANFKIVKEWLSSHPLTENEQRAFYRWIMATNDAQAIPCLSVSVVLIDGKDTYDYETLSLAWTFFDAVNSGGKRLSDYDLLKAHHLRYLSKGESSEEKESLVQNKATTWDTLGLESIDSFNESRPLFELTLGQTLYLIRSWIRNRPIQVGKLPGDGRYEVLRQYSALTGFIAADLPMNGIQAGIVGGKSFFDWTERYISRYRSFASHPAVQCFHKFPWINAQNHLRIITRAAWFLYYCKFDDVCMADAIAFLLYRLGKLRNEFCRKGNWYGSDLVKHTIEAIDESPTVEFFFQYCQMPSNRYTRHYNLKDSSENSTLAVSWRYCPEFWKRTLALISSSNPYGLCGLGQSICYKQKVKALFGEIANDFEMALDSDLNLTILKKEEGER